MVTTIIPAVFVGRREKWIWAATMFVIAGVAGGALTGWLLGTVGALFYQLPLLPHGAGGTILGAVALSYALHELELIRLPTIPLRRQVNRGLRAQLPLTAAVSIYGLELGAGLVTRIPTATVYVVCLGIALVGDPAMGAIIMGCFGLSRSMLTLAFSAGVESMDAAITRSHSVEKWEPTIRLAGALSLIAVGVIFILRAAFKWM